MACAYGSRSLKAPVLEKGAADESDDEHSKWALMMQQVIASVQYHL